MGFFVILIPMFSYLESVLISFAHTLSLETFVLVASFVEEVVAPIPSPTVMLLAGSFAKVQEYSLFMLLVLAVIGAIGKTIGAILVYFITDKAEDIVMYKFGKFFNVTHEDVESFGKKLGHGMKDYVVLTALRALPFMPSVVVSVGSGLLKVPLKLFIISTFLGTIIRDGIYLYTGYIGTQALTAFVQESTNLETYVKGIAVVAVLGFLGYRMIQKRKNRIV